MGIDKTNNTLARKFLCWLAGTVACGVLAVIAFVGCIDPYNLYGWFEQDGINTVKPDLSNYAEEIKLTHAVKLKPDTLIFGNSRAEIGFDPESPAFVRRGYSVYNLAIRGTSIKSSHRQLEYLLHHGIVPKRMIIALDFVDFINASKHDDPRNERIAVKNTDFPVDRWHWRFDSLFSMMAIRDTVRTLRIQTDDEAATMTGRGFNPLREYLAIARQEGYFALFRQKAETNAKVYLKKAADGFDRTDFMYFRAMLKNATNVGSEVIVVIYPYHSQLLALFEEIGLLPTFSQWKNEIVSETERFSKLGTDARISIIDFSGYGEYQCERIPSEGDLRSTTKWYWEAGHFKKMLGDIVIERSLVFAENLSLFPQDDSSFGVKLNSMNFDVNFRRMDKEKSQCAKAYPELFEDIKTLAQSLR